MVATLTNRESERESSTGSTESSKAPIVVVGNGPVGLRFLEQLTAERRSLAGTQPRLQQQPIIAFGEEPRAAYDRINLTTCLEGRSPRDLELQNAEWYSSHGIELRTSERIVDIDPQLRIARTLVGEEVAYESLVLATGSRPFVPPIQGTDLEGVFLYRTVEDLEGIRNFSRRTKSAAVLGGGLLGLEAARALVRLGMETHVVEMASVLMARQLDNDGAALLRNMVEELGVRTHVQRQTDRITEAGNGLRLEFRDGLTLNVDMIVISTGIRPRDELARSCDLKTGPRGGFVINDELQTSQPDIYAIGECACHRGTVYGLAAPGFQMAGILAGNLCGESSTFEGSDESTKLKLLGVDVALSGSYLDVSDARVLTSRGKDFYRRLVLRHGRIVGASGVGSFPELPRIQECITNHRRIWWWQRGRFERQGTLWEKPEAEDVTAWPAGAIVCSCRNVARGTLTSSCQAGCRSAEELMADTGAGTVCGSCLPMLAALAGSEPALPVTVPGWRCLLASSIAACFLIPLLLLLGPIAMATSVQDFRYRVDILWRDAFWQQTTGFALLAVVGLALVLSFRKRIRRFQFLNFGAWRAAHGVLGVATILGVLVHTGMRTGANLNFLLMASFLGINFAGGLTGAVSALESRLAGKAQRVLRHWRPRLTLLHIIFFWPFPVLIVFHIVAAYYF